MTIKTLTAVTCAAVFIAGLPFAAQAKHHRHHAAPPPSTNADAASQAAYDRQACEDRKAAHGKTGTLVGAAAGGIAGGLIGKGSTAKTLLGAGIGAGAGALAGHQVGKMTVKC